MGIIVTKNKDRFTLLEATDFRDSLELTDVVEVDSETTGFDFLSDRIFSLQVSSKEGPVIIDCESERIEEWLPLLKGKKLIFHNAKFDLPFFMRKGFFPSASDVVDTMIQERCLTLGTGFRVNLSDTAKRRIGVSLSKERQKTIANGFRHQLDLEYAWKDVMHLTDIHNKQIQVASKQRQVDDLKINSAFTVVISYLEYCGIKLDKQKWQLKMEQDTEIKKQALADLNSFCKTNSVTGTISNQVDLFSSECEVGVNWDSPKQVLPVMQEQGIDCMYKKKLSVSAKYLVKFKRENELVRRYLYYKEKVKDCSTYGDKFLKAVRADGRIHTSFNQLVSTGRMSCGRKAREKGQIDLPNLQNIPKVGKIPKAVEARYCFIPEEGNVFVIADYASQESRLLADLTEDPGLLDFYLRGEADLHSYVAKMLWPEICGDMHLDEVKEKHPDLRDKAKSASFAIAYGGNGHTIAENANIPDEEGEEVYEAFMSSFPGVSDFFEINLRHTLINGYITINQKTGSRTFPRHIPFSDEIEIDEEDESVYAHSEPAVQYFKKLAGEVESDQFQRAWKKHRALKSELFWEELNPKKREYERLRSKLLRLSTNYLIQGTAALQTKMAGILFYNQLLARGWINIVKIVNVIHDEYVIECPASMGPEVQKVLVDCMVTGGNYFMKQVVMDADAHIDTKWSK